MSSHSMLLDYADKESGLLRHVSSFDQQMKYLSKLINTINVQNLTQVSCHLNCLDAIAYLGLVSYQIDVFCDK